jgi:hypothetical protein
MQALSHAITTLVRRMESNPEEFFGDAPKWRFIFKENFREVLTEAEKGTLHTALLAVRRLEFDGLVVATLLIKDEEDDHRYIARAAASGLSGSSMTNIGMFSSGTSIGAKGTP